MSPRAFKTHEVATKQGSKIAVEVADGFIGIRWTCGTAASFTRDQMLDAMELQGMMREHPGVSLAGRSNNGYHFSTLYEDGRLYINPDSYRAIDTETANSVNWNTLEKALHAAIASLAKK